MSNITVSTPACAEEVGDLRRRLRVGVVDRDAGARVEAAGLRPAGLGAAAEPVLGPERGHQVDPVVGGHHVDLVAQVGDDAGRVGDQPDPLAGHHPVAVAGEGVEAGEHAAAVAADPARPPAAVGREHARRRAVPAAAWRKVRRRMSVLQSVAVGVEHAPVLAGLGDRHRQPAARVELAEQHPDQRVQRGRGVGVRREVRRRPSGTG